MMSRKRSSVVSRAVASGLLVLVAVGSAGFMVQPDTDLFFKINKSIDVFGRVYKEVAANYVDTIDPEKFMRIHRSNIVNIERIKEIQPWFNGEYLIILKDDTRLTLSRKYRERFKDLF